MGHFLRLSELIQESTNGWTLTMSLTISKIRGSEIARASVLNISIYLEIGLDVGKVVGL